MDARQPVRQGDLVLIPIDAQAKPRGLKLVERDRCRRLVVADGESTGHCHAIVDDTARLFRQADRDETADRFLTVEREVSLAHQEHAPIALSPGEWIVRRKREYSPASYSDKATS